MVAAPRLARHRLVLQDGHEVGIAVSGRGVPLVVIHGFSAEGFLYAQTLNRLVLRGFKVIAIDMAGHGGTQGMPRGLGTMADYADLLGRALAELGIRQAVLAGHSMGGRLICDLAAAQPERVVALLLLDAIVGDTWDRMVGAFRLAPWLMGPFGAALLADSVSTIPLFRDRRQALKFVRLLTPTLAGHVLAPWRLIGPAISILRSPPSGPLLDRIRQRGTPLFVIQGERDLIVPARTARDASQRGGGHLVTVHGAAHSWLLRDPETLPAIVEDLLAGELGVAVRQELSAAGAGDLEALEAVFYEPGARIVELTPELVFTELHEAHRHPRYTWSIAGPG